MEVEEGSVLAEEADSLWVEVEAGSLSVEVGDGCPWEVEEDPSYPHHGELAVPCVEKTVQGGEGARLGAGARSGAALQLGAGAQ